MTQTQRALGVIAGFAFATVVAVASSASAQVTQTTGIPATIANRVETKLPTPPPPPPAPDYVIGVDDVLTISVWGEAKASSEVTVRPDGKIGLTFGDEIVALGLRPDDLKAQITKALGKYYEEPIPNVSVSVKLMASRRVYITGPVAKPGPYILSGPMTVGQLISIAGGLQEFANRKDILVISATLKDKKGQPLTLHVNYNELSKGVNMAKNNIELRPGDQVIVR